MVVFLSSSGFVSVAGRSDARLLAFGMTMGTLEKSVPNNGQWFWWVWEWPVLLSFI